ncbi:39S ribosomal protein L55, mitochondrial [Eurytemora carolleeae]|uniref:39S ribosomal protein L55, mitochondrial n=1 Tax=Eurytemora carolleeae TaxID=1294199 RepID=UPI000C773D76|nr:39S ribosomal protein L55, mitochondrial [Eurytemora carolleeae]|eukprot:XP_023349780.1 39S ribosomal protein L55, mitochondrial-like [Eurytemora affinis]
MNVSKLVSLVPGLQTVLVSQQRNLNCNRAGITRTKRAMYMYQFPTSVVNPDGSTIQVKYPEPRVLLKLPLDLESATPAQKRQIQLIRRPKQALKITEDTGDSFDPLKYI